MYLNKLNILKRLQETRAHLGGTAIGPGGTKHKFRRREASRPIANRTQSYIYGIRQKQSIIHLDCTITSLRRACNVIQNIIQAKGHLLFINTNLKYNKIIKQTAHYTNQSYINYKWIGGFLTNWSNMRNVQQQFELCSSKFLWEKPVLTCDSFFDSDAKNLRTNSQQNRIENERCSWGDGKNQPSVLNFDSVTEPQNLDNGFDNSLMYRSPKYKKMQKCFEGTKANLMNRSAPDCVIIFNANQNSTAIYEAHLNQIPIIALVDSHIPDKLYNMITYPIPVNCESVYFIYLLCNCITKTICYKPDANLLFGAEELK